MSQILKVQMPQSCNGCELCVLEAQRQLKKIGLDGALIRVFREQDEAGNVTFSLEIDPRINNLDLVKIVKICPQNVFTITEAEHAELIS